MTQSLITGSLAFDYLLRVHGRFGDNFPASFSAGFTAAYISPEMRRTFGGCAGNIAYGLRQLDDTPILMAVAGEDIAPYRLRLHELDIDDSYVLEIANTYTAQAVIASDEDESQINIFHPGATAFAHQQSARELSTPPKLAMVSPNGREGMLRFGRELSEDNIPFVFDPGQAIGLFSADELREMAATCTILIFNQDEYSAFEKISGAPPQCKADTAIIVTLGSDGSQVTVGKDSYKTKAAQFGEVVDTTGCGDAYRAALVYGWTREWNWQHILNFASVLAGIKAIHSGAQDYQTSAAEVSEKCEKLFGNKV